MEMLLIEKIIKYIEDDNYVVMWIDPKGHYYPLRHTVIKSEDELIVYFKNNNCKYIDLYNISKYDIKIYAEIKI